MRKCPFWCRWLVSWSSFCCKCVCETSSSVFFSEGVPSGISSSGCERGLPGLLANSSLSVDKKGIEKIVLERKKESMHSAWIGQLVAKSLGGGIDSRKDIDLWQLQTQHKNNEISMNFNETSQ